MMNYRHDNKKRKWWWLFGAAIAVIFLFWATPVFKAVSSGSHWIGGGVSSIFSSISYGVSSVPKFFIGKQAVIDDNLRLREELASKEDSSASLELFQGRLEDLENSLSYFHGSEHPIMARIISSPRLSLYHSFVIDAGGTAGITAGDIVYAGTRSAVGVVKEVSSETSTVELLSSPYAETEAYFTESKFIEKITGLGPNGFFVKIPHDTPVVTGETVVLSTDSEGIVGKVVDLTESPQDPFKTIFIGGLIDPVAVRQVFILKHQ